MAWTTLFLRQFSILFWKNWIVLSKHPFLNTLRCLILPIAYGIFLAVAQLFLEKPNNFGLGSPAPVASLQSVFDGGLTLVWADGAGGVGVPTASDIMARVTRNFTANQQRNVKKVASPEDIASSCPQNFNLLSECFAAVSFNNLPSDLNSTRAINYTILADGGLVHIDVINHKSDFELRVFPLQWAIDEAIIFLRTGKEVPTPLEWPFSQETNAEQSLDIRLQYIRGLRSLLVLALFICYVGIAYQLPGSFMGERANLLTSHLRAMGLLDSSRIMSWYTSLSLAYLPAWVIVAIIWHFRIFSGTGLGLVVAIHLLLGLSLASWSFFTAAFFGKNPQLAAVCTTFLAVLFAILAQAYGHASTGSAFVYSIIFPPGFYIFAIRAVAGFEIHQIPTNVFRPDPDNQLRILPLLIAAVIDIILWPCLTVWLEHLLYNAKGPSRWRSWTRERREDDAVATDIQPQPGIAVSINNLKKTFNTSILGRRDKNVIAVSDLTLNIQKYGITVLLGPNGAGKSTTLSIVGGLLGLTSGSVVFDGKLKRPPRGTVGIVPQKNVLFPELTCYQTLLVWSAIKRPVDRPADADDVVQLLKDCDLEKKIHSVASTLSGGQKRKLQLAIGLIGGSELILVDECSSGVDPLSRRALWRTLTSIRNEKTIILTTHFLDEADLLADNIAILRSPGLLVAEGSPVSLKSNLGRGYTVNVTVDPASTEDITVREKMDDGLEILRHIQTIASEASLTAGSSTLTRYHLNSKDPSIVKGVLRLLESNRSGWSIKTYTVESSSMEDIFLSLMESHGDSHGSSLKPLTLEEDHKAVATQITAVENPTTSTVGRKPKVLMQAFTILRKRMLIGRRSWLASALAVIVPILGSCIPLFFMDGRVAGCSSGITESTTAIVPLYLPFSPFGSVLAMLLDGSELLTSPPNITEALGSTAADLLTSNVANNDSFVKTIDGQYRNLTLGGVSMDLPSSASLFAWEASPPGLEGSTLLNLVDNLLYNNALNTSDSTVSLISPQYQSFPAIASGSLTALKWIAFYGATMAVFPAFFSLYVSKERHSSVQAMMQSNGLGNPAALWLGHLMFDTVLSIFIATVIVIVFAVASQQFQGLGFYWFILLQYGAVGALFAYACTLLTSSPLAAFATVAGYQVIMFILYVAGYLLTFTYAKTSSAPRTITIIHFTLSCLSPVASVLRAAFVSINQFSLLCDQGGIVTITSMGSILEFGGPILYLFVQGAVLFAFLVRYDSGSILPRQRPKSSQPPPVLNHEDSTVGLHPTSDHNDVLGEMKNAEVSQDALRVLHVSKKYSHGSTKALDDVSFGVSEDTVFALLGPNGAGKTTLFNLIRGDIAPDEGEILLNNTSVIRHKSARLSLGVCPQFTAIDSQMTVQEHLIFYGRLKGLAPSSLESEVDALMRATALDMYADRLASKLSGGNQRKLSLAIALIGDPSIILIDEFSTGVDARMKREMWTTLRRVAAGKAMVLTTHSMEEASALANKIGLVATKLLAIGTTESLAARYPLYEVHISCRTPEDVARAQQLMSRIPGSQMADDLATRFEVPIGIDTASPDDPDTRFSLAQLFKVLSDDGGFSEYAVEPVSLETIFMKVIRENRVLEEDSRQRRYWWNLA